MLPSENVALHSCNYLIIYIILLDLEVNTSDAFAACLACFVKMRWGETRNDEMNNILVELADWCKPNQTKSLAVERECPMPETC